MNVSLRETHYEGRFADDVIRELTSPLTKRDSLYSVVFVDRPPYERNVGYCKHSPTFRHDRRPELMILIDDTDTVISATATWSGLAPGRLAERFKAVVLKTTGA